MARSFHVALVVEFTFNLVHFGLKTIFVGVLSIPTVASDCHASVEAIYNISICQLHLANFNAHHGPMHDMVSTLNDCIHKSSNDRENAIILNGQIMGNVPIANHYNYRDKETEVKIVVLEGRHEGKQHLENES
ncbi:hypothetical protein K0M31_012449 [Melipona bicolor]|uniref:Uncharacterized protein n=1 Tax=Melipona bicolor TaxID=60889 RepID=A0AA40KHH0_9HYME|nr:hypothetical protein K0M31_012449 [Melipona bicolor]